MNMIVLGHRVSAVSLGSGDSLAVVTEPAQCSVPSFTVQAVTDRTTLTLQQSLIMPLGTHITYSVVSRADQSGTPVPALCLLKGARAGSQPLPVFPLHNAVDVSIAHHPDSKIIHVFWWWNAWSPDYVQLSGVVSVSPPPPGDLISDLMTRKLPQPPQRWYAPHSVPDPYTPAWLRSLVPKTVPGRFDSGRPFWVAPIADGYGLDLFPLAEQHAIDGDRFDLAASLVRGESRANGPGRLPETNGARLLQSMVARGLLDATVPASAPFNGVPSLARDDWERRGGIVAAGEHIRLASVQDAPEFVPKVGRSITGEVEMAFLPGVGMSLPAATTWEDHLVIVRALTAHYDYANLGNATRVLMYARGSLLDHCQLSTVPIQFGTGPSWPSLQSETVTQSILLLDFPQVVGSFASQTNYRTLINPDKVIYPYLDFPEVDVVFNTDGFLVDGATPHRANHAALDFVLADPVGVTAKTFDYYRNHIDLKSF